MGSGGIVFYLSYKVWQNSSVLDFQNGKATVVGDVKSINPSFDQLSDLLWFWPLWKIWVGHGLAVGLRVNGFREKSDNFASALFGLFRQIQGQWVNCCFGYGVGNHFWLRLLEDCSGSCHDNEALVLKILGGQMGSQKWRVETHIHHLKALVEVIIVLDVSSNPSASGDDDGLVRIVELLELFNDFLVVFNGIEVFVQQEIEGCIFILSEVDVWNSVWILEDVDHLFAKLTTSSDEQNFFH